MLVNMGGLLITISLEGCTHRLADVGNRVHTRHDSDEDVRGNAFKQAIAWKALPWSFIIQANKSNLPYLLKLNVEVKPSRLLFACSFLPRALPPVTNIGKPMCIAFQASLSCRQYFSAKTFYKNNNCV